MIRMLYAELQKVRWWLVVSIIVAGPLLSVVARIQMGKQMLEMGVGEWEMSYSMIIIMYAHLFLPISVGVFAALLCRDEHIGGGWKQILALPISRLQVFLVKYVLVISFVGIMQLVLLISFVLMGLAMNLQGAIPWQHLLKSILWGWVATLPLAALQLWVSSLWKNFAAPLALNVAFTIPAMLAANSATIGPWYLWSQPLLAMLDGQLLAQQTASLYVIVIGLGVLFLLVGSIHFVRRDWQ